ncbi:c-type cytochrome [Pyxidicoccus xibeiensis]|uniref:c-type cytochrome n=1 Tax=Pyxidicoccus xibeiensis TaxID=2906759 RepID=UPI0020A784AB|nr:c-type cytochrome [Pyxidicoccus xibeiensis]MCP3136538.1 cytochrome c [Pyxidicoccus xibeiensis]
MIRSPLLALLLLPCLAAAEDGGEAAFAQACARCHTAGATTPAQPSPGPHLDPLVRSRTPEQLRAWLRAPHQVRPETRCDTRLLDEGERDLLLSYLATVSQPPAPPREELLRQQLQQEQAERRARKQRRADEARLPVRVKP